MRTKFCSLFVSASLLGTAAVASAQDGQNDAYMSDSPPEMRFEITPLGGFQGGGRFDIQNSNQNADVDSHNMYGIALGLRNDPTEQYELLYTRQETNLENNPQFGPLNLNIEYLHVGGTVVTNDERRVQPYIAGGLGVTRFNTDLPNVNEETHFSINFGGGLRVPFNPHFSLRLEARGFLSFVDTNTAIFCASGSNGGFCNIRGRGNTFFQYNVLAGAAFAF
jgi:opacity protein-like surface antigen